MIQLNRYYYSYEYRHYYILNEELYLEIIRKKTATLIAACCAIGAKSVNAQKKIVDKLFLFGELIGITFQIRDDLFD